MITCTCFNLHTLLDDHMMPLNGIGKAQALALKGFQCLRPLQANNPAHNQPMSWHTCNSGYEVAHMKTTTKNPAYKAQKQTFCFVIVLFTVLALMAVFL